MVRLLIKLDRGRQARGQRWGQSECVHHSSSPGLQRLDVGQTGWRPRLDESSGEQHLEQAQPEPTMRGLCLPVPSANRIPRSLELESKLLVLVRECLNNQQQWASCCRGRFASGGLSGQSFIVIYIYIYREREGEI